jgi:hypothetical protein
MREKRRFLRRHRPRGSRPLDTKNKMRVRVVDGARHALFRNLQSRS